MAAAARCRCAPSKSRRPADESRQTTEEGRTARARSEVVLSKRQLTVLCHNIEGSHTSKVPPGKSNAGIRSDEKVCRVPSSKPCMPPQVKLISGSCDGKSTRVGCLVMWLIGGRGQSIGIFEAATHSLFIYTNHNTGTP